MALEKIYITGTPGLTYVQDSRLAYVEIMVCCRECKQLTEVSTTPVGNQFKHLADEGKVVLDESLPIEGGDSGPGGTTDILPEEFYFQIKS